MKQALRIAAAITSTAVLTALPGLQANAAPLPEKNIVMLGDSIFANPTDPQVLRALAISNDTARSLPGAKQLISDEQVQAIRECLQGEMTVAKHLQEASGRTVHNYACAAATGAIDQPEYRDLGEQIDRAVSEGTLNAKTGDVLLQFGFNDYRHDEFKTEAGNQKFVDAVSAQIARVRAAAPNANIKLVSYPTLSDENRQFCPVRIVAGNPVPVRTKIDTVAKGEDLSQARMVALSEAADAPLIDLKAASKDCHTCSGDSQRWVAGIIDVPVPHSLFMHLTDQGVIGTAQLINDNL